MGNPDMAMVATDTTTAKKLPKKLPTMSPLSPLLMCPSLLPTLNPSRPALTSPSICLLCLAKTFLRKEPSKSLLLRTLQSLSPNVLLNWVLQPAKLLSLLFPSRCARNLLMDMLKRLLLPTPQLILPSLLLNKYLITMIQPSLNYLRTYVWYRYILYLFVNL